MKYKTLELKQGSTEWLEYRKKKITATDAGIIMGSNKFGGNSPLKLWQKKMGFIEPDPVNFAMAEGSRLEEEARLAYNLSYQLMTKPACIESLENPWMMASVDGILEDGSFIEIKCGEKSYALAEVGEIPQYYKDQMTHTMHVLGVNSCFYVVYRPDRELIVIKLNLDQDRLKLMLEKEQIFFGCLEEGKSPANAFVPTLDGEAENELAERWKAAKEVLKEAQEQEEILRDMLIDRAEKESCYFEAAGVKLTKLERKGNVDYDKLLLDHQIDKKITENYRKKSTNYFTISY